jgi:hypothetical protein
MSKPLLSHSAVRYRVAPDTQKRCGTCTMFIAGRPSRCRLVQPPIRSFMLCSRFVPKREPKHAA